MNCFRILKNHYLKTVFHAYFRTNSKKPKNVKAKENVVFKKTAS